MRARSDGREAAPPAPGAAPVQKLAAELRRPCAQPAATPRSARGGLKAQLQPRPCRSLQFPQGSAARVFSDLVHLPPGIGREDGRCPRRAVRGRARARPERGACAPGRAPQGPPLPPAPACPRPAGRRRGQAVPQRSLRSDASKLSGARTAPPRRPAPAAPGRWGRAGHGAGTGAAAGAADGALIGRRVPGLPPWGACAQPATRTNSFSGPRPRPDVSAQGTAPPSPPPGSPCPSGSLPPRLE